MTTTNLWKRLKQLLPEAPLLVGVVDSVDAYGALVLLPDGSLTAVRGTALVGDSVFIRAGLIEGPAPALTAVLIEV